MKVPVLFIIFNRPELTKKVFQSIRHYKPNQLFIVADGPRHNNKFDINLCKDARKIIEDVDWICEVKTLFRENNLGCKQSVIEGITWFFKHVNAGIILEDDCLPNNTFFEYCNYYLDCYANYQNVFAISGSRFNFGKSNSKLYFGKYALMWGWATWSDRWSKYNVNTSDYTSVLKATFQNNKALVNYWEQIYFKLQEDKIDTWDFQWILSVFREKGLVLRPPFNLIKNLGFTKDATHTQDDKHLVASLENYEFNFPFLSPEDIEYNEIVDSEDEEVWLQITNKNKYIWKYRKQIKFIGNILRQIKLYR